MNYFFTKEIKSDNSMEKNNNKKLNFIKLLYATDFNIIHVSSLKSVRPLSKKNI